MKALVVCATYGRLPYLGRMLSSFIHQTYDDKHLVIVNDDKNVEICCDRKDVTIINTKTRLQVPYKRNIGISIGDHDVIFPMDDDDIFLPKKIANHIEKYDETIDGYWSMEGYMIYGDKFVTNNPGPHNAVSFLKKAWYKVGGYTTNYEHEDSEIYGRLYNNCNMLENPTSERDFVYGFGGVNYHLSATPRQILHFEEMAYKQLEDMNLVGKKFWIHPDFEQFNNVHMLSKLYEERQVPLTIKHLGDAKIDISHLL